MPFDLWRPPAVGKEKPDLGWLQMKEPHLKCVPFYVYYYYLKTPLVHVLHYL